MIIETIAYTVEDAVQAQLGGADRIELVTGMLEGGLTPSYGLIKEVVKAVSIPVHIMIRPHSLTYSYDDKDLSTMLEDIEMAKQLGASGVVVGMLKNSMVDVPSLEKLLKRTDGINITFHRAFDEVIDQETALNILLKYPQITRILTSGKEDSVFHSVPQIRRLIELTEGTHLTILPGSGLKSDGIRTFVEQTGAKELHFGSGVRMNGILTPVSPAMIAEIKRELE